LSISVCDCRACLDLAQELSGDPELLEFYRINLLKRGWAGKATPTEKAYIHAHADWTKPSQRLKSAVKLNTTSTEPTVGAGASVSP
jgi:hypothetical protein